MDILDETGVSKLSAKVFFFFKVNYSFKNIHIKSECLAEILSSTVESTH